MQKVAIVGAGLAGSLLAVLLRSKGFSVHLSDRRPDSRKTGHYGGRSINLALSHRGIRALRVAGLDQAALSLAIPMRGRMLHDRDGTTTFQPYSHRPDEHINSISRAALNELLLDAAEDAGAELQFDSKAVGIELESATVSFQHAGGATSTYGANVIVGADGAGSVVRQSLERAGVTRVSVERLDHAYKELTIPPTPDGRHALEPEALHIWPRHSFMLIALPNLDGSFTCTLFLPAEGTPGFDALNTTREVQAFFASEFPDAVPLLTRLEADFEENPTSYLQTIRCDNWHYYGQAVLIGDAAHAIVPFFGQGMNAAFEDCRIMSAMTGDDSIDWADTFVTFNSLRKPDADAIADLALSNYVEMRDRVSDPRFQLQKELESELARRYPGRYTPIYSHVTFSDLRYSEALRLAQYQQAILDRILDGRDSLEEVDWRTAEALI